MRNGTVAASSAGPQTTAEVTSHDGENGDAKLGVTAVLALCRFARDGAAFLLWGGCLYVSMLAPTALRVRLAAWFARCRTAAVVVAAIAVVVLLPAQAAALGDGWADALDPGTVWGLLFETTIGTAWLVQAGAIVLLLVVTKWPRIPGDAATAAVSALLLTSLTLTGHAAMHEGWLGAAHRANHILHLLSAGFWFGALLPLLPTLAVLDEPDLRRDAASALRRFSLLGHGAVVLVIATGTLNTLLVLGRWPTDWSSPYQALLAFKIALVAVMASLAVVNRYVVVPWMRTAQDSAVRSLRAATLAEVALGLGAIACVGIFGLLEPS